MLDLSAPDNVLIVLWQINEKCVYQNIVNVTKTYDHLAQWEEPLS